MFEKSSDNVTESQTVRVGIMTAEKVRITFLTPYADISRGGAAIEGSFTFAANDMEGESAIFRPLGSRGLWAIEGVMIGIGFHWQRLERQVFEGELILMRHKSPATLTVINNIDVERYLRSVISSEMNPNASEELLKAHAVISRSWVMSRILNPETKNASGAIEDGDRIIRWYDRDGHEGFDVCADDHCQRYQGETRIINEKAEKAVEATAGEILTYNGEICDARFSKCCGGAMETFDSCWSDRTLPYLAAGRDFIGQDPSGLPDLTDESEAIKWISRAPESFCNTSDRRVLRQVLNGYDLETSDFYRWKVEYTNAGLSELIRRKTGIDFGEILSLTPMKRGASGRIVILEIKGIKRKMTVGKELEIRKTLSDSHLYSSAFFVEPWTKNKDGIPTGFTLHGAGWGHGAGLCQIGAAMMAEKGYSYREILDHYYPGSELTLPTYR